MTQEDIKNDYLVRDVNTNRTFHAEYSSESAEYYEVGTGKSYSPDEIEFVNEPQEDKELLLKDLCARLPYGIECKLPDGTSGMITSISIVPHGIFVIVYFNRDNVEDVSLEDIKPYLRPMSSMTEEENEELKYVIELGLQALESEEGHNIVSAAPAAFEVDFYNKHHIDYRGLIPMGLALEAPRDMYKTE